MAKKGGHYVKQPKKTYISRRDKKLLVWIGAALAVAIAAFFIITSILDDSLDFENGAVVGMEDNWIVANAGDTGSPKYYKYAEYDFSSLDAEVIPGVLSIDENSTSVEVRPSDGRYADAYIYAVGRPAAELADSVEAQLGSMLAEGQVHSVQEFMGGYLYWYTTLEAAEGEDGVMHGTYLQIFTLYMPTKHDSTLVLRTTYEFDDNESYVSYETGCKHIAELLECITIEE